MNNDTNTSTDIAAHTDARRMWRFLTETQKEIFDLKVKARIYADAYFAEMRKADMPYVFKPDILSVLRDRSHKAYKFHLRRILHAMFGEDFLKAHDIRFDGVVAFNDYVFEKAEGYYLNFSCEGVRYEFYIPNIQCNIVFKKDEDFAFMEEIKFSARWTTDGKDALGSTWYMVNEDENESYDWKVVTDNIKRFIENRANERNK